MIRRPRTWTTSEQSDQSKNLHMTLRKILVTANITRHLTSAANNCSICVCVSQQTYESLYTNSLFFSDNMFNISIFFTLVKQ